MNAQRACGLWPAIVLAGNVTAQVFLIPLNDGWRFSQQGEEHWYSAQVPGVVQTDLLRHGLIPDPYRGNNIDSVQWVEQEDWIYRRNIPVTDSLLRHGHLELVFKGLDTFADIHLNDSLLGKADNMFRTWAWDVKRLLHAGDNELKVIFRSPIREGEKLRNAYGIQLPHDNDPSGVSPYIRKAAYQFGWDFCPRLVTSGIWQGVELRVWDTSRITRSRVFAEPAGDTIHLFMESLVEPLPGGTVRYLLDGLEIGRNAIENIDGDGFARYTTSIASRGLWWPNGSGPQEMHVVTTELLDAEGWVIDRVARNVGFRTVELIQTVDSIGRSFSFRVNGRDIFMKGCNMIPPSLVPVGGEAWVRLVSDMQRAGMNMVRIWAGGIYPPEAFLEACDTAGILVWQDFILGNLPPGNREFLDNLRQEAAEQVERISAHPSLALFCADNELDVAWHNWGWQDRYDLHGADSTRVIDAYRKVQGLLAEASEGGRVPFTPTSPLSNWGNAEGLRNGDLHYWGVWHGDSTFSSFANNVGRFVSEYGFQSYPDSALLARYVDPRELHLGSPTLKRLQRSYRTDRPILEAIKRELGHEPATLGGFIEDSQEVQKRAYRTAIEAHMAARPHCMGTLFWQLNDCWPGPSWSLIDFDGRWKPGMHEVQQLYLDER